MKWAVELVSLSLVLLALVGYWIREWFRCANAPLELKPIEKMPDEDLVEGPKPPEQESDPECLWWELYYKETTLSLEEFSRFVEGYRKSGELLRRFRDENWSEDRLNLEFIAAGLIDDERTAIAMTLVAGMREKFEKW